jgi:hypothetical protein
MKNTPIPGGHNISKFFCQKIKQNITVTIDNRCYGNRVTLEATVLQTYVLIEGILGPHCLLLALSSNLKMSC